MKNTKIVSFFWDNARGEEYNGRHLFIGQHLPKAEDGHNAACTMIHGIGIHVADKTKDMQLSNFSCHNKNLVEDSFDVITKEAAREMILKEIDFALDVLFDEGNIEDVEEKLNKSSEDEDDSEEED